MAKHSLLSFSEYSEQFRVFSFVCFDTAVWHMYCTYVDFQAQPRAFHVAHVSHATVEQAPITFPIPRKSVASVSLASHKRKEQKRNAKC